MEIIVVLFERKNVVQFFEKNLNILKDGKVKLLLVDNGDNKNFLPEGLEKVYIKNEKNYGYGKSINIAADLIKEDYFLVSNDDIVLEKYFFRKLEKKIEMYRKKNYAIVGFNIFSNTSFRKGIQKTAYNPFVILYHFSFLPFIFSIFDRKSKGYLGVWEGMHFYKSSKEVFGVNGSLMLINKYAFEKIGKFDPEFFLTYEETDLFLKMKKKGYKIFYDKELKAFHEHNISASKDSLNYSYNSMDHFLKKHYGKFIAKFIKFYLKIFLFFKKMIKL